MFPTHCNYSRHLVCSSIPILLLAFLFSTAAQLSAQNPANGKRLYEASCSTCHGTNGKGAEPDRTGLSIPVPDFTECVFATREPDDDWHSIIHQGGPARAFNRMMPAFGDALNPAQIDEILAHVRTFCKDRSWPRGELNLPRPLVTEKAFPEDEAVITTSIDAEDSGAVLNKLIYEQRLGSQSQFEIAVPVGALENDENWSGGIGDVAVGFKRVLYHSHKRGSIFSFLGEVVLPTGDSDKDFGKGTTIIEPTITFGQIFMASSFVQFHGGFELSTNRDKAAHEAFWRATVGKTFSEGGFGRSWSPMVEILGAKELEGGSNVQWDVVPQVQVTLSTRQHVRFNAGVRVPINETDPRSTQIMIYLLWDWFDGGLFDGW